MSVRIEVEELLAQRGRAENRIAAASARGEVDPVAYSELERARFDAATLMCVHSQLFSAAEENEAALKAAIQDRNGLLLLLTEAIGWLPNVAPGGKGAQFKARLRDVLHDFQSEGSTP
jgi:hypothetical protein